MNRMYTSLMLESLYERVESSVELKKFNAAGLQLMAVLDAIPSFRDMARERLQASLQELVPGLQPEKVFVNRGADDYNWHLRPQGPLVDVYLECLVSGLSPNYILNIDGVYDRPTTTDPQYRVSGLRVEQIERLIDRARSSLNYDHQRSLERYWSAIAAPASTYKNVLRKAFASALMAQLSLSVMGRRLELHHGEHAARLMVSGTGRSVYAVRVDEEAFPDALLTGGFVIDLSNLGAPQLALNHDHYGCVLYTPARGFEFFISSYTCMLPCVIACRFPVMAFHIPGCRAMYSSIASTPLSNFRKGNWRAYCPLPIVGRVVVSRFWKTFSDWPLYARTGWRIVMFCWRR